MKQFNVLFNLRYNSKSIHQQGYRRLLHSFFLQYIKKKKKCKNLHTSKKNEI